MTTFIIVGAIFVAVLLVGFYLIIKRFNSEDEDQEQPLVMLQNQINEISRTLDSKLSESTKAMQQQFGETHKIVRDVTQQITKLDHTNKQVVDFADQLRKLQDILKNPKQRGILGEYYLETLLKNAFQPKQYQMQYKFKDGEIVDAVLFVGDKIIPIDSKFSLENYNRIVEEEDPVRRGELEKTFKQDLKNRIEETAKYIRPQEGTTSFAFMFIPAEGIFYDLLVNQIGAIKANTRDLIDYAAKEKNVHVVSPTTFYVTLQAMWQGMNAYKIQESTKEILKNIDGLSRHLNAYQEYFRKLGTHMGTAVNTYNSASKEFKKIDKDILRITGETINAETMTLEKPLPEGQEDVESERPPSLQGRIEGL